MSQEQEPKNRYTGHTETSFFKHEAYDEAMADYDAYYQPLLAALRQRVKELEGERDTAIKEMTKWARKAGLLEAENAHLKEENEGMKRDVAIAQQSLFDMTFQLTTFESQLEAQKSLNQALINGEAELNLESQLKAGEPPQEVSR